MNYRIILFIIYLIPTGKIYSQIDFSGIYQGTINHDPTKIIIKQSGNILNGEYLETGNTYLLKGKSVNNKASGELIISNTGQTLASFEALLNNGSLELDLLILGLAPLKGQFEKVNSGSTKNELTIGFGSSPKLLAPSDNLERDRLVVGNWMKEEIINSGFGDLAASLVTVYYLKFNVDGSFFQEKSGSAGGTNWSGISNRTADISGFWYTKNQILYIKPEGSKDYIMLNRYLFHEGNLVFKTEAGKYLIWLKN